jgi:hypothetical protein
MAEKKYPGRGAQRKQEESRANVAKLHKLEVDLGAAHKHARQIEQAARELAERLDVAFKSVFPGS